MATVRLETVPFTIDPEAIALGLLAMFNDDERDRLRLGLLPADKMHALERALDAKFRSISTNPIGNSDKLTAWVMDTHEAIDFSMRALVSEAVRLVVSALYKHGDLVV